MKIQVLYFLILIFTYFSCKQNETNAPPVNEATMVAIMTEVYYMDVHFNSLNSHIKDSILYVKINVLLNKYGINKEQFEKAKVYYSQDEKAQLRLEEGIKKVVESASVQ